jgi:type II secretory pathway component PulC
MGYYQELLDQPERLLKVFDSLAPLYNEERAIEGYRLNIEGEAEFFAAAGLRQNDVVRKVNGIEMTNRRRAENLIRRFAQDDLDIVVLELERDGAPVKQVYEMK